MAILDRVNKWFAGRLPSHRQAERLVQVSDEGLRFARRAGGERVVQWTAIDRVVAVLSPNIVGDTTMLVFGLVPTGVATVTEADPAWSGLLDELHLHCPGTKRPTSWQLELIATKEPVELYRR